MHYTLRHVSCINLYEDVVEFDVQIVYMSAPSMTRDLFIDNIFDFN